MCMYAYKNMEVDKYCTHVYCIYMIYIYEFLAKPEASLQNEKPSKNHRSISRGS